MVIYFKAPEDRLYPSCVFKNVQDRDAFPMLPDQQDILNKNNTKKRARFIGA